MCLEVIPVLETELARHRVLQVACRRAAGVDLDVPGKPFAGGRLSARV